MQVYISDFPTWSGHFCLSKCWDILCFCNVFWEYLFEMHFEISIITWFFIFIIFTRNIFIKRNSFCRVFWAESGGKKQKCFVLKVQCLQIYTLDTTVLKGFSSSGFFHESIEHRPSNNPLKYFHKIFCFCVNIRSDFWVTISGGCTISGYCNPKVVQPPGYNIWKLWM